VHAVSEIGTLRGTRARRERGYRNSSSRFSRLDLLVNIDLLGEIAVVAVVVSGGVVACFIVRFGSY